ncbi:MAG TPA: glycine cleavage T C-terminal barrel domain-containing protein [Planctomycetota bacterium]|nr:glycine cleavage T C-terminal barrel domain-containing protein [Planctomycetota bacterium]
MNEGYRALREGAALVETDDAVLELEGKDALPFLHRMVANDVKDLAVGQGRRTLLLDLKGHCLGDLGLLRTGEQSVALILAASGAEGVESTLGKYGIADDFQLARADLKVLALQGPKALDAVTLPGPVRMERELEHTVTVVGGAQVRLVRHDRTGYGGYDLLVAPPDVEKVKAAVEAVPATDADLDLVRLESGRARYGHDFGPETIPQEARLEEQSEDALSFEKGCFFGQEVVARLRFRGHVNKILSPLVVDGEATPGTPLVKDGKEVGRLTSVGRSPALGKTIALGYVKRDLATAGTELSAGAARARVAARGFE